MPTAWRIVKSGRVRQAFDGEGARLYGGRWNSPGPRVVYTAESAALAALELLVHLQTEQLLAAYSLISVAFDSHLVESILLEELPSSWRGYPAPVETQEIGNRWLAGQTSVVLRVPSVIVPLESNFLVNPSHPEFRSLSIGPAVPFTFDARLRKR